MNDLFDDLHTLETTLVEQQGAIIEHARKKGALSQIQAYKKGTGQLLLVQQADIVSGTCIIELLEVITGWKI